MPDRLTRADARARVIATLAHAGALSRTDLARRAGLAPSTVSAAVGDLLSEGLVHEPPEPPGPPERPSVGRPPVLVALHRRAGLALGIDLGRRHVRVALADLSHAVLAERTRVLEGELGPPETAELVAEFAGAVRAEAGASEADIVGIGMGVPAPLHLPGETLGDGALLPAWYQVDFAAVMSEALGRPVAVDNDANLGALSESMWGAGRGADHLAYLKVATGIGAGLVMDGRPFRGAGGTAGEIGHVVIDPGGPPCRCGNRGCLETVAGSAAMLTRLREELGEPLTLEDAIDRALAGDDACRAAITRAGRALGAAVATLANLLNPQLVVVGGDFVPAGEMLLGPVREEVARVAIDSAAEDLRVALSALGPRAHVLGAVALVLRSAAWRVGRD